MPLNFAALAFESPFDRDTVESCVKEVLGAISRAVGNKRNVELTFAGVGKLSIRESKVKMRFYKEFITQMDGSGKLIGSMQNVSNFLICNKRVNDRLKLTRAVTVIKLTV